MTSAELLLDAHGRIAGRVHAVARDVTPEELHARLTPEANTIAWLLWHLARVQDHHVSALAGDEQTWVREQWGSRLGLANDPGLTGYGQSAAEVGALRIEDPALPSAYYDAVAARTAEYLRGLDDEALDAVIDRSYDPPVTVGVRLVSVIDDDLEHAGQAAFIKGCVRHR